MNRQMQQFLEKGMSLGKGLLLGYLDRNDDVSEHQRKQGCPRRCGGITLGERQHIGGMIFFCVHPIECVKFLVVRKG